jgi:opacity protein-like surface antigen
MKRMSLAGLLTLALVSASASAEVPDAIAVSGETLVVRLHAEGAQIYECKADASGKLAWQFREPIATLIEGGKTVGRHYAGPHWELADSSVVAAKAVGQAPGATAQDIPLLKLEVTSQAGNGRLTGVTTVQRLDTKGGMAQGACSSAGALLSAPYSADYAFYRKAN